jgi:hypothetical protein
MLKPCGLSGNERKLMAAEKRSEIVPTLGSKPYRSVASIFGNLVEIL